MTLDNDRLDHSAWPFRGALGVFYALYAGEWTITIIGLQTAV